MVTVQLPQEVIDQVIEEDLKWHYNHCLPNQKPPMFSYDPEEDEKRSRSSGRLSSVSWTTTG